MYANGRMGANNADVSSSNIPLLMFFGISPIVHPLEIANLGGTVTLGRSKEQRHAAQHIYGLSIIRALGDNTNPSNYGLLTVYCFFNSMGNGFPLNSSNFFDPNKDLYFIKSVLDSQQISSVPIINVSHTTHTPAENVTLLHSVVHELFFSQIEHVLLM